MPLLRTLTLTLLLLSSSPGFAVVEGYSFHASRLENRTPPTSQTETAIPYETLSHHTRHRKYHSALSVNRQVSQVSIVFHTKQELISLRGPRVNGFSRVHSDGRCEIHVMMPYHWNDDDAMRTVGHELMHCFGAEHERGETEDPTHSQQSNRIALSD